MEVERWRGWERKQVKNSASYQTVQEEGCRRCPWVTAQRWRARRLCCQSKAQGRWVLGQTVGSRRNRKKMVLHITSCSNPGEHTPLFKDTDNEGFAVTVLVCVSSMHSKQEKNNFPTPDETHTLIYRPKLDPHSQRNPPLCTIS